MVWCGWSRPQTTSPLLILISQASRRSLNNYWYSATNTYPVIPVCHQVLAYLELLTSVLHPLFCCLQQCLVLRQGFISFPWKAHLCFWGFLRCPTDNKEAFSSQAVSQCLAWSYILYQWLKFLLVPPSTNLANFFFWRIFVFLQLSLPFFWHAVLHEGVF